MNKSTQKAFFGVLFFVLMFSLRINYIFASDNMSADLSFFNQIYQEAEDIRKEGNIKENEDIIDNKSQMSGDDTGASTVAATIVANKDRLLDGHAIIEGNDEEGYKYSICVREDIHRLIIHSNQDSYSCSIDYDYIDQTVISAGVSYLSKTVDPIVSMYLETDLDEKTYKFGDILDFQCKDSLPPIASTYYVGNIQLDFNKYFLFSMNNWNKLINDKTGYSLVDIGFVNYDNVTEEDAEHSKAQYNEMAKETSVKGVKFDQSDVEVGVEETVQLKVSISPSNATNKELIWSSSDESVAIVNDEGEVKGIGAGTATIRVKTRETGFFDTCNLTVSNKSSIDGEHFINVKPGVQNAINDNLTTPLSCWRTTCGTYQKYTGMDENGYEIRLEEMYIGGEAWNLVKAENSYNKAPSVGQQWVLMRFSLKNTGISEFRASTIVPSNCFYDNTGASLNIVSNAVFSKERRNASKLSLSGGASGDFWYGILISKSVGFPYLKLSNHYPFYTWLNTDPEYDYESSEDKEKGCHFTTIQDGEQKALIDNQHNPMSIWKMTTGIYQEYKSENSIPYKVRLEELYTGEMAKEECVSENPICKIPTESQQWLLFKFYLENNGSEELTASRIVNEKRFCDSNGAPLEIYSKATFLTERKRMAAVSVKVAPKTSAYFWIGILVDSSKGYPLLKINNGLRSDGWYKTDPEYVYIPSEDDEPEGIYYNLKREGSQIAQRGNKEKPLSLWRTIKTTFQKYPFESAIACSIRAEELYSGEKAWREIRAENKFNKEPTEEQQWILFRLHLRNEGGGTLETSKLINKESDFYTNTGTKINIIDTAIIEGGTKRLSRLELEPGTEGDFWVGILVDREVSIPSIRLSDGLDETNNACYTWASLDPEYDNEDIELLVTFDNNGKGERPEPKIVKKGEKIVLPEIEERGWKLEGWYEDTNFTKKYDSNSVFTENITLYARWLPVEIEEISIVPTEISIAVSEEVDVSIVTNPIDAQTDGIKWMTSNENIAAVIGAGTKATIIGVAAGEAEITVETPNEKSAKCRVKVEKYHIVNTPSYKISFIVADSIYESAVVREGTPIDLPDNPSGDGEFIGWYYNGRRWDPTCPVLCDMNLIARFSSGYSADEVVTEYTTAMDSQPIVDITNCKTILLKGQKFVLSRPEPSNWYSDNKQYVSISKKGEGIAKKEINGYIGLIRRDEYTVWETIQCTVRQPAIEKNIHILVGKTHRISLTKPDELPVTWWSSDPDIASVSTEGVVYALSKGSCTITAYMNGMAYNSKVKVTDADTGSKDFATNVELVPLQSVNINRKGLKLKNAKWESDLERVNTNKKGILYENAVVRVSASGKLTAVGAGKTVLKATSNGSTFTYTIQVSNPVTRIIHMNINTSRKIKVYGSKGTINWKASNTSIVSIEKDKIKGVKVGKTTLQADYENLRYNVIVYVEDPHLSVAGVEGKYPNYKMTLREGDSVFLKEKHIYQSVLFRSNKNNIAFVDESGVLVARNNGKAKLTSKINGKKITLSVTVIK